MKRKPKQALVVHNSAGERIAQAVDKAARVRNHFDTLFSSEDSIEEHLDIGPLNIPIAEEEV